VQLPPALSLESRHDRFIVFVTVELDLWIVHAPVPAWLAVEDHPSLVLSFLGSK
jgi:hypothetical protein